MAMKKKRWEETLVWFLKRNDEWTVTIDGRKFGG